MKLYWYINNKRKYSKIKINLNTFSNYRINKLKDIANSSLKHEQIIAELFLQKVLIDNKYINQLPIDIKLLKNNKPYIQELNKNYSNSHSNSLFGVVISNKNVAIDIEHKKRFSQVIAKRWNISNRLEFVKKYTIYESLMKLLNDYVDFNLIEFENDAIKYKNKTYHLKIINVKSYLVTILSDEKFDVSIKEIKRL